ncbi:MAG: hypothetical protein KDA80_23760 [Planctomycetaceae bacterium]|nr:hypothetical protein [Planctomycetaceae bacterium]
MALYRALPQIAQEGSRASDPRGGDSDAEFWRRNRVLLDKLMSVEVSPNGHKDAVDLLESGHNVSLEFWLTKLDCDKSAEKPFRQAIRDGDTRNLGKLVRSAIKSLAPTKSGDRDRVIERLLERAGERMSEFSDALNGLGDTPLEEVLDRLAKTSVSFEEWRDVAWLLILHGRSAKPKPVLESWRWLHEQGTALLEHSDQSDLTDGLINVEQLEIQLLFGLLFQSLKGGKKQSDDAVKGFRQALEDSTDTDGTPHAKMLSRLPGVLNSLIRVSLLEVAVGVKIWKESQRRRLGELVDRVANLGQGSQVAFTDEDETRLNENAWRTLLGDCVQAAGLEKHAVGADWLRRSGDGNKKKGTTWSTPDECHQSDWAEWGSFRSSWELSADVCNVRYHQEQSELQVAAAGRPLLQGAWTHALHVGGQQVDLTDDWSCVCWFDDEDAALMELQQTADDERKLIRQVILLRNENLLLLADSVRTGSSSPIHYERTLPLVGGGEYQEDSSTREAAILERNHRVRIVPLGSVQDRIHGTNDSLIRTADGLQSQCTGPGACLYSPIVFEWHSQRRKSAVEWAPLTVAEDGKPVTEDYARGFRLRIGRKQWLLYHSLVAPEIPRTVLGLHTASETVLAEILPNGEFNVLVEVEL